LFSVLSENNPALSQRVKTISVDGSCNGYQHLSAMGLDPIGGRATNLIPGVTQEDVYQWVADLVRRIVEIDAQKPGPIGDAARQLPGKIDRGLVKVPTMTIDDRG
jgi:DNA-directed RNA polymerase